MGEPFLDLGVMPLANSFLNGRHVHEPEPRYPLRVFRCEACNLIQLIDFTAAEIIFSAEYAYFSSFTESWLRHAERYAAAMIDRFELRGDDLVVEIGSNDGYLLQYFKMRGIPVLGVEPAHNCAEVAREKGIRTVGKFFGAETAREIKASVGLADLVVANNVLAHVPDIHDFVHGVKLLLKEDGLVTMEFPHLLRLLVENQFDTIYHEHFSYLSLSVVDGIFKSHDLVVFDVEELPTHGGSLRIFAGHDADRMLSMTPAVSRLKRLEEEAGLNRAETYRDFAGTVERTREQLLSFLREARGRHESVVGYGAPAKGNTLLNYCGIGPDLVVYTVDISPHKQSLFLPGSHLPIHRPDKIRETRPEYVLILPWNIKDEVMRQLAYIREWGGRFAVPIPELAVLA